MTADIVDTLPHEYKFPIQQVTIGHLDNETMRHHTHIQVSGEGLFIKARGNAFVMSHDDLVKVGQLVEPLIAPPPWFKKIPTADKLTVEFSDELKPKLQWKWSDSPTHDSKWSNIKDATEATLTKTDALKDKWVSCVASSDSGATATPPIKL